MLAPKQIPRTELLISGDTYLMFLEFMCVFSILSILGRFLNPMRLCIWLIGYHNPFTLVCWLITCEERLQIKVLYTPTTVARVMFAQRGGIQFELG